MRRVNDKRVNPGTGERQRLSSAILPPSARKTPRITEVLPPTCTACRPGISCPRWVSSSAPRKACRGR